MTESSDLDNAFKILYSAQYQLVKTLSDQIIKQNKTYYCLIQQQ